MTDSYLEQFKVFFDDKLPEMKSFIDNVDAYETFIKDYDLITNLGFDLKKKHEVLRGCYDEEGAARYAQRGQGVIHPDSFTTLYDGKPVSKVSVGT